MSDPERMKQLLIEAKDELGKMEGWMKNQEPAPGVPYEEWMRSVAQDERRITRGESNKNGHMTA